MNTPNIRASMGLPAYPAFDAANPPGRVPPGMRVAMGYIGRPGFTPHVWSVPQWQVFARIPQIPYWVPNLSAPPAAEAQAAATAAKDLGWAPHMPGAKKRAIVFDFETAEGPYDRAWWADCGAHLEEWGFTDVAYGSLSTVLELAATDLIVADWDGDPVIMPGQTIRGHQYQAGVAFDGTSIDYTMIDQWLYDRAGQGPRHS